MKTSTFLLLLILLIFGQANAAFRPWCFLKNVCQQDDDEDDSMEKFLKKLYNSIEAVKEHLKETDSKLEAYRKNSIKPDSIQPKYFESRIKETEDKFKKSLEIVETRLRDEIKTQLIETKKITKDENKLQIEIEILKEKFDYIYWIIMLLIFSTFCFLFIYLVNVCLNFFALRRAKKNIWKCFCQGSINKIYLNLSRKEEEPANLNIKENIENSYDYIVTAEYEENILYRK